MTLVFCLKTYFDRYEKFKSFIDHTFLLSSLLIKAQPGNYGDFVNLVLNLDTNIKVDNLTLTPNGILSKQRTEAAWRRIIANSNSSKYIVHLPLWKENIISYNEDSTYVNILVTLIKGLDTMNVRVINLLHDTGCNIEYFIHAIPFSKGNFTINVNLPSDKCSYKGIYQNSMYWDFLPCCDDHIWDITPQDWEGPRNRR
jgi:hypothetical protein